MNTNQTSNLKINEISQRFQTNLSQFEQFLSRQENEQLQAIQQELRQNLHEYYQNGVITIAFIGQYSAGKSTIISALTGRRDIYIDADIATDTTTQYNWNGIKIIDTPGIYTEREDHDQITYDAIEKADLLVFCLTSMLFDNITADNFKKLAYDQEYAGKMMLVINKMSQASGEEEDLIANYKDSLAKALTPYSLDAFPVSFIDAKDYCEGIDEEEELLVELSGFPEFIEQLNQFIEKQKIAACLDTPVRIVLSKLNETELAIQRDQNEDNVYLELINRCKKRVEEERDRFRTEVKNIALHLYSEVRKEANPLVNSVSVGSVESEEEWEKLDKQAESNIDQHCDEAQEKLEKVAHEAQDSLRDSIQEILEGDLAQAFKENWKKQEQDFAENKNNYNDQKSGKQRENNVSNNIGQQIKNLKNMSDFVAKTLSQVATRNNVYQVGKFLGVKFKPYGAVNAAKHIGNAARVIKFAGPALAIAAFAFDIKESKDEEKQSEELSKARQEINGQFTELAQKLQTQLESIGREVEKQLYDETADKIEQMREAHHQTISENQEQMQQLNTLRQQFREILSEIDQSFR